MRPYIFHVEPYLHKFSVVPESLDGENTECEGVRWYLGLEHGHFYIAFFPLQLLESTCLWPRSYKRIWKCLLLSGLDVEYHQQVLNLKKTNEFLITFVVLFLCVKCQKRNGFVNVFTSMVVSV